MILTIQVFIEILNYQIVLIYGSLPYGLHWKPAKYNHFIKYFQWQSYLVSKFD